MSRLLSILLTLSLTFLPISSQASAEEPDIDSIQALHAASIPYVDDDFSALLNQYRQEADSGGIHDYSIANVLQYIESGIPEEDPEERHLALLFYGFEILKALWNVDHPHTPSSFEATRTLLHAFEMQFLLSHKLQTEDQDEGNPLIKAGMYISAALAVFFLVAGSRAIIQGMGSTERHFQKLITQNISTFERKEFARAVSLVTGKDHITALRNITASELDQLYRELISPGAVGLFSRRTLRHFRIFAQNRMDDLKTEAVRELTAIRFDLPTGIVEYLNLFTKRSFNWSLFGDSYVEFELLSRATVEDLNMLTEVVAGLRRGSSDPAVVDTLKKLSRCLGTLSLAQESTLGKVSLFYGAGRFGVGVAASLWALGLYTYPNPEPLLPPEELDRLIDFLDLNSDKTAAQELYKDKIGFKTEQTGE